MDKSNNKGGKKQELPSFFNTNELKSRYKEWNGMPEFIQNDEGPYKTVKVHFTCQKDVDEFASLIQQRISKDTKWIYCPKQEKANLLKKVCVDDIDES